MLQFTPLIERIVASVIAPGAVSALRYAELVARLPLHAAGVAIATVIPPTLARLAHSSAGQYEQGVDRLLRIAVAGAIPLMGMVAALGPLLATVAFGEGRLAEDRALIAVLVLALAPTAVQQLVQPVVIGAHNARQRGLLLGAVGTLHFLIGAGARIALGASMGVVGLALGGQAAALATLAALGYLLIRMDRGLHGGPVLDTAARSAAATIMVSGPIGVVVWFFAPADLSTVWAAIFLIGAAVASLVGFVVVGRALRISEYAEIAAAVSLNTLPRSGA